MTLRLCFMLFVGPVMSAAGIAGGGELGHPLSIRCVAYCYPQPSIACYRGPESDIKDYEARANELPIRSLDTDSLGEYVCQAYNGVTKPTSLPGEVVTPRMPPPDPIVPISTAPVRTEIRAEQTTLSAGAELNLPCEVDGHPEPDVYWSKDGVPLQSGDRIQATSARLTVSSVTVNDSGVYCCNASNGHSQHSSTVQINVQAPVRTEIRAEQTTLSAGAELNLPCEVDGHPEPDVYWSKDGVPLQSGDRIQTTSARLTVSSVTVNDSGVYCCNASNGHSQHSSTVQIKVQVSATLAAKIPNDAEIHNVFGVLQGYQAPPGLATTRPVAQAKNGTLVDCDYWDSCDEYQPSSLNYDDFDWTVSKRIEAMSDENFLLSPLGLKLTMATLAEAATGSTKSELSSVLSLDNNRVNVRRKFSSIIASMKAASTNYELNLGSKIYVDSSVVPRQRFSAISHSFYNTELEKLDFGHPLVAASQINAWVTNITRGKIHNFISEVDVEDSLVLVLTTLFFKGTWRHQFNPNATNVARFYLSPSDYKQVPFMNVKNSFFYAESAKYDAKILRLPYLGNKFSMFIVVPNSLTGLSHVMNSLADLRTEMLYLQERTVDVTIPKFNFDFTSILDGVLKEMGIRQAFEDTASFPGLASTKRLDQQLSISKVLQKSGIEINELGSVAYSATEVSLVNKFGEDDEPPKEVIANKPFLFFIEDEATRQLLLIGRVSNPLSTIAAKRYD